MKKSLLFVALALGGALPFTQLPAAHAQGTLNTAYQLTFIEIETWSGYNEVYSNYTTIGGADGFGVNGAVRATGNSFHGGQGSLGTTKFKTILEWTGPPQPCSLLYTYSLLLTAGSRGGGTASGKTSLTIEGDRDEILIKGSSWPSNGHSVVASKAFDRGGGFVRAVLQGDASGTAYSDPGAEAMFTAQSTVQATVIEGLDTTNSDSRLETTNP